MRINNVHRKKSHNAPLITIVGPTASGKTSLAIRLAKRWNGAVICADSRTVYKGMDIGTAKPTTGEMNGVPHYLLDLVEPNEPFTLFDFQQLAKEKIAEIRASGKIPFLVGGSGLYIDSVLFDYRLGPESNHNLRSELEKKSVSELQQQIKLLQIRQPENSYNKRYLIRAIEQNGINRERRRTIIDNTYVVGIATSKEKLAERIYERAKGMFTPELLAEVKTLNERYGDVEPLKKNIYGIVKRYLNNEISLRVAQELAEVSDRQLAKKQMTWFRRNKQIEWLELEQAEKHIDEILNKFFNS